MSTPQDLELEHGARLRLYPQWIDPAAAEELFARLRREVAWRQQSIRLFGRTVQQPRLSAWYGSPEAVYVYSGLRNDPLPWTETLGHLRQRLEAECGAPFNGVLLNLYRDGQDAMGFHADAERELGPAPLVASVSLGAARRFVLRPKARKRERTELELTSGSLLVMLPPTQAHYQHGVPRQPGAGARINLTFRRVMAG